MSAISISRADFAKIKLILQELRDDPSTVGMSKEKLLSLATKMALRPGDVPERKTKPSTKDADSKLVDEEDGWESAGLNPKPYVRVEKLKKDPRGYTTVFHLYT